MTKVRDVYQAILALSTAGVCDANQQQIIQLAGISERHFRRYMHELEELGLIRVVRYHNFRQRKTKNRYFILGQSAIRSPITPGAIGHQESDHPQGNRPSDGRLGGQSDSGSPVGGVIGLPESGMHDSCMLHGEDKRKNWFLLDFLNEPERSLRASECPPKLVAAWRELKDFRDQNELWELLGFTNPAGWINTELKNLRWPPPLQMPLPGGAVDLSEFKSRGMTREEIEATLRPSDGATLGEDGIWR